jgi:hypothetical protein
MKMQAGLKKQPSSWEGSREKRPLLETLGQGQCVEVRRKYPSQGVSLVRWGRP